MPELTASNPISAEISASDKPTGTKHITENGVYDVSVYQNADVDIPMPEGDIELTHNNQTYDVSDKATATVNLPMEVTTVHPSINDIIISPSQGYEGIKKLTMKAVTAEIDSNIQPENIAYGKTILGVNGSLMPPTLIQKSITANGTYSAEDDNADGYREVTVNVPVPTPIEEKAVNFYDYDGTVLYAYTAQEALALTELPEAPTHEGLVFQGWNRTLAQLQAYVTDYGIGDAGATYITDDGATRLYLEVGEDVPLDYELYVRIANGTLSVEVNGVELGSATETTDSYVNYTIPLTLPNRGNVRVDLKFTGTGGFHIGQGTVRTRVFGWNSDQNDTLAEIELGSAITSFGSSAFRGCSSLNSVVIPDSVTNINVQAFNGCSSLNSVVIPDSVTNINAQAFNGCSSLNSVVIPDSVTSINVQAFNGCFSLNSVVIPDSVTNIGNYAFNGCFSLNSVVIPDSVTSINVQAFNGCSSLNSVVIPDSVTNINAQAFNGCFSLNSVVIPDSVTNIGNYAFNGCSSLNSVVIPDSVTSINVQAFNGCSSLNSVVIPDSVTNIGNYAFNGCFSLNSVVIPDSVTSIGGSAFNGCSSLNSVVIPDSVTSIGDSAFRGCSLLLFFDLFQFTDPNNLPTFSNSNFLSETPTDQIIYVANQEMLTAFSSATNISVYANRMVIKGAV